MEKKKTIVPKDIDIKKSTRADRSKDLLRKMMQKEFKKRIHEKADSGDENFMKTLKNLMSDDGSELAEKLMNKKNQNKPKK